MKGVEVDTTMDYKFVLKKYFLGFVKDKERKKVFFCKDFLQFSKFNNLDFFNKI